MLTVSIHLDSAVLRKLEGRWLDSFSNRRKLRNGIEESLQYLQGEVQRKMAVDSGRGRGSVFTDIRGTATNLRGIVASPEVHVVVMELGRRPGKRMPPLGPIRLWLQRHGGDPSRAFVVARAIGRRGSFGGGLHMFARTAKEGSGRVVRIIASHLKGP